MSYQTLNTNVRFCSIALACILGATVAANAQAKFPSITLRAASHSFHNCPVTVTLPGTEAPSGYLMLTPNKGQGGTPLRAQATTEGGKPRLTFILDDLAKGEVFLGNSLRGLICAVPVKQEAEVA